MSQLNRNTTKTKDRLIQAAIEVFSSAGVVGATTREIARVAGVNEVTLFRHFQSKEQLLGAVAAHITALNLETLLQQDQWAEDLHQNLLDYARLHDQMLEEYEALVRMFIGEAKRHPHESLQVLQQYFLPLREQLIAYLRTCVNQGIVRADVDLPLAVDQFTGMLLAGMLRRHVLAVDRGYSRDRYVEASVNLLISGITTSI
ncbi:transcriptional regulator [Synechococcus sp. PCC 7502]|uniref:TetR/AcrR family transcriptional regulator n=1 Tax=Synechococcus sp. PCC 7502 TaxID=1173263 RepID=UPI00029FC303|nr:TetR/AcrR family transcriptional regulator [Synechococcus sp. PCC 7502]AFY74639.1 transcriptional regulator [Synechococcus sp. PCC 7502]